MRAVFCVLIASFAALPLLAREPREEAVEITDTAGLSRVDVELPVGSLIVRATDGPQASIEMRVNCGWRGNCERADRIALRVDRIGETLMIRVENFPESVRSLSVDFKLEVPRTFALTLEHGVGDSEIIGLLGDIEVELGVGDVFVESAAGAFRSVSAEVGVGDADFRLGRSHAGERAGFLFLANEVEWDEGTGDSRIEIEVGVGDADVNLK